MRPRPAPSRSSRVIPTISRRPPPPLPRPRPQQRNSIVKTAIWAAPMCRQQMPWCTGIAGGMRRSSQCAIHATQLNPPEGRGPWGAGRGGARQAPSSKSEDAVFTTSLHVPFDTNISANRIFIELINQMERIKEEWPVPPGRHAVLIGAYLVHLIYLVL